MPSKEVALDLASFLDSPRVAALGPDRAGVRRIAEGFLEVCYDELGVAPRLLDGHDVHHAVGHLLPARFKRKDPLADHAPDVLRALVEHLAETVRTGVNTHHHVHRKQDPHVHRAPKTGRNDPCVCGSGKKFKKCCGKG